MAVSFYTSVSRQHFQFVHRSHHIVQTKYEAFRGSMAPSTVGAIDSDATGYTAAQTPHVTRQASSPPPKAESFARKWFAIRWQLARTVFARPVPFVTEKLELKLGDLLITLPVAAAFIAVNAAACSRGDVGGSGSPAMIVMIVVFALAVRNNSILLFATGIPFDRALFYHKLFGVVAWVVTGLHGLAYLLRNNDDDQRRTRRLGRDDDNSNESPMTQQFSGALAFYALSALVAISFEPIRRRFFDLFLRAHWILFIMIVVFCVIHGAALVLLGFVPWAIDMIYRIAIRAPRNARKGGAIHASHVTVKVVANDLIRVQFPRLASDEGSSFHYEAGQYVFLCFPQVAKLEWHPFTIASAPPEPQVTIYIKALGDWTKLLAAFVKQNGDKPLAMLVDGPYGAEAIEMDCYSHFVFVSGGIGVTPMLSLANDLFHTSTQLKSRVKAVEKVRFVWSVRDRDMVQALMLDEANNTHLGTGSWLPHVLTSASNANSHESDAFVADVYLTNKSQDLSHAVCSSRFV